MYRYLTRSPFYLKMAAINCNDSMTCILNKIFFKSKLHRQTEQSRSMLNCDSFFIYYY